MYIVLYLLKLFYKAVSFLKREKISPRLTIRSHSPAQPRFRPNRVKAGEQRQFMTGADDV